MNTNPNETNLHATSSPTSTDPPHPLPAPLRLQRATAVLDCLGDALLSDGREYSSHIGTRADVCDFVADELKAITALLEGGAS
ncbi:MAG: hypothetical protein JST22_07020 [Bacteroidetes bacterium]|nr:hypothetical protein [Bacteroidota bacterium]